MSRTKWRNQQKRAVAIAESDVGEMDYYSNDLLKQIIAGAETANSVVDKAVATSGVEAERLMLALKRVQCYKLSQYASRMQRLSSKLGEKGCWQFAKEREQEAISVGIREELQHLAFQSAAEFADRRMAKLTRTYGKDK